MNIASVQLQVLACASELRVRALPRYQLLSVRCAFKTSQYAYIPVFVDAYHDLAQILYLKQYFHASALGDTQCIFEVFDYYVLPCSWPFTFRRGQKPSSSRCVKRIIRNTAVQFYIESEQFGCSLRRLKPQSPHKGGGRTNNSVIAL